MSVEKRTDNYLWNDDNDNKSYIGPTCTITIAALLTHSVMQLYVPISHWHVVVNQAASFFPGNSYFMRFPWLQTDGNRPCGVLGVTRNKSVTRGIWLSV